MSAMPAVPDLTDYQRVTAERDRYLSLLQRFDTAYEAWREGRRTTLNDLKILCDEFTYEIGAFSRDRG